ncbi:MAG: helix-turn-helix domain-containing protein [Pirellulales bacterium]|nr:helix-turn-helix domain-containing protein [Pirellulales bacterium]
MREHRRSAGLSQEALADVCGLHRTYIGSVERGERNISIDNMEVIATALGCGIVDLLRRDSNGTSRQGQARRSVARNR